MIYAHKTKVSNIENITKSKELVKKGLDQYIKKDYENSIKLFNDAVRIAQIILMHTIT